MVKNSKNEKTSSSRISWGKVAAGVAAFFIAINIGGVAKSQTLKPLRPNDPASKVQRILQERRAAQLQKHYPDAMNVPPLFEHGQGSGGEGFVVSLSEEEGMQVIKEELAKHGIKLGKGGELKDVVIQMPLHGVLTYRKTPDPPKKVSDPAPLDVDAMDPAKKVFIEFVSKEDFEKTKSKTGPRMSMRIYNPKKTAENLVNEVAGKGNSERYLGVFYDPMARLAPSIYMKRGRLDMQAKKEAEARGEKEPSLEERTEAAKKESKKLLRQQAQDFTKWLGTQGVIKEEAIKEEGKKDEKLQK